MSAPRVITVVSPQFPCGAAWLANACIELGVLPTDLWGFDTAGEWEALPDGSMRYVAARLPWRQTLPSLRLGRQCRFESAVQVRFTHLFPWQLPRPPEALVLIARDPRDALHSQWRRLLHNRELAPGTSFAGFCAQPFADGPIGNADFLWLHLQCWLEALKAGDASLIRFEDWKRDDPGVLAGLLKRLRIERSRTLVESACDASRFERLRDVESEVAREDPEARQFNRRGMANEWMLVFERDHHAAFGRHWAPLLQRLDYVASPSWSAARPDFDAAEVLRWRGLEDPVERQAWTRRIEAWKAA